MHHLKKSYSLTDLSTAQKGDGYVDYGAGRAIAYAKSHHEDVTKGSDVGPRASVGGPDKEKGRQVSEQQQLRRRQQTQYYATTG